MIIRPPIYEDIYDDDFVIFLAGPIIGTYDWQQQAIANLQSLAVVHRINNLHIASPRRLDKRSDSDFSKSMFDEQVDWETFYLNRAAAKRGVILFWLAKEIEHDCHRVFAQTTRFELGEWKTKHEHNPKIHITIGVEPGFTGYLYMNRRIQQDCKDIEIMYSLEDECEFIMLLIDQYHRAK